jgi:hypothetical protein
LEHEGYSVLPRTSYFDYTKRKTNAESLVVAGTDTVPAAKQYRSAPVVGVALLCAATFQYFKFDLLFTVVHETGNKERLLSYKYNERLMKY